MAKTTCSDDFDLSYTLPMSHKCEMKRLQDGSMVQSIPKLIPLPSVIGGCHRGKSKEGISSGHRICRIPYCVNDLCNNGWCEETMVGYNCHCSSGFQGRNCDEQSRESSTKDAATNLRTSPTTTKSDTTTSQETTTSVIIESTAEAITKSTTSPTTTMSERSDTTTSQNTATSQSTESSTSASTTKLRTSPTTTIMSDTTTSLETTTSTCSSPPVEHETGGSSYNFSTAMLDYASAVSACSQYGSHLVFIESESEEDFIVGDAREEYWIGLTGSSPSEARWLDGSSLTYSHLKSSSFNENGNCFRIAFYYVLFYGWSYSWEDEDCSRQLRFICEK